MNQNNKLNFEVALQELQTISNNITEKNLTLNEMIESLEKGVKLHKYCSQQLEKAKIKIEKVLSYDSKKNHLETIDQTENILQNKN